MKSVKVASEASPQYGGGRNFVLSRMAVCGITICAVCTEDSRIGKIAIATFANEENGCRFDGPRKKNMVLYVACLVNSCQEKDAGVLFRLNYSIHHQHTGIGSDTNS